MNKFKVEFFVGLFMIAGLVAVSYMAIRMGDLGLFQQQSYYQLEGRFESVSGLKEGAAVELSGVKVGRVASIEFDAENFEAVVIMELPHQIQLPTDSIASIRTSGIIGDKYVKVSPGGDDEIMAAGDQFEQTESTLDIEELISKFMFKSDAKEN